MSYANSLLLQTTALCDDYVRHAASPGAVGPWPAYRLSWARWYEARGAAAEANPAFAVQLLPASGPLPLALLGASLPLLPAGVRYVVDELVAGTISVTVDVAGGVSLDVLAPGASAVFSPPVTLAPTRASVSFAAKLDGLYELRLRVGTSRLATIYVPVQRAEWRRFRENSRALGFAFNPAHRVKPSPAYTRRLALLIAADAAAATGQPQLYERLSAAAAAVERAPTPTRLSPHA